MNAVFMSVVARQVHLVFILLILKTCLLVGPRPYLQQPIITTIKTIVL